MIIEIVPWIGLVFTLIGILLNAKKNILCWPVWLCSNFFWLIHAGNLNDVPQIVVWTIFSVFNVYGWVQWNKSRTE
jgi:hypothetical protein